MYFAAVIGARYSGKTALARACARFQDSEVGETSRAPRPFAALPVFGADALRVLDPIRHTDEISLGRELARRMPLAVLLTLPRDADSASQSRADVLRWANLARAHSHRVRLALVVTKCDAANLPLDDVAFERAAFDAMQVAGVEHIFYTEALRRGAEGVRDWLMDVLAERQQNDKLSGRADNRSRYTVCLESPHWGVAAGASETDSFKIAHADSQQRTCDQCVVS